MDNLNDDTQDTNTNTPKQKQPMAVSLPTGTEKIPIGSGVITRRIGFGGMAAVYEIWNDQLEVFRAIKILIPGSEEIIHQRFITEMKISAKLKHPNIIDINSVGEWNGLPYIEMEKLDGSTLDHIITERGGLSAEICTAIGIMICRALHYAHTQQFSIYGKTYEGVIHRDLKPANIMITTSGAVKLMDFGIARPVDVSFHTVDGLVSGTMQYLAPEQIEKSGLDFRTDLYSLGVTLYEIVTGTRAFTQTNFAQIVTCKTKSKYLPLKAFPVRIPNQLSRLICKCMHHEMKKRVESALALLRELEKIHAKLTDKSPEDVLKGLMSEKNVEKNAIIPRRLFPWKTAMALMLAIGIPLVFFRFGLSPFRGAHTLEQSAPQNQPMTKTFPAIPINSAPDTDFALSKKKAQNVKNDSSLEAKKIRTKSPGATAMARSVRHDTPSSPDSGIVASLQRKYAATDTMTIIQKAMAAQQFDEVVKLFEAVPNRLRSNQMLLLKMKAVEGTRDSLRINSFFNETAINDAGFYLEKAKNYFNRGKYGECLQLLDQSLSLPHFTMGFDALNREVCYYRALCKTAFFDSEPNEQTYKTALNAWWQLRSALRFDRNHEYNSRALDELQRMAKKMQKG